MARTVGIGNQDYETIRREGYFYSDLNNLKVVTTTSENYADCFGFTEKEVFAALEEYGLSDQKQQIKAWYDGFTRSPPTGRADLADMM